MFKNRVRPDLVKIFLKFARQKRVCPNRPKCSGFDWLPHMIENDCLHFVTDKVGLDDYLQEHELRRVRKQDDCLAGARLVICVNEIFYVRLPFLQARAISTSIFVVT
jgi:hypothetical protein